MRALLVEDEEGVRTMLAKQLRSECFAVDTASDGIEGSYLARTNEYDIIVLDNLLPGKSGHQVCEEIRRAGNNTPILLLSVMSDVRQKTLLINSGADDYMVKPFSFDELMARMRALMRRPAKVYEDTLVISDIELDPKQQSVRRGGKKVYLTRKEFMLLEYLMRNEGIVLSRSAIMEHVWDMSSDPFSNTIEAHILSLRKKLSDTKESRLIQTVPGRGYKIQS